MARIKGLKRWDGITIPEWYTLFATKAIISDLMMRMIFTLYHAPKHTDNAGHLAEGLFMEYRALNAAVGWAGNKIKDWYETKSETDKDMSQTRLSMAPWQYVFDGKEDEYGTYLWMIKPAMLSALSEIEKADISVVGHIWRLLAKDNSSFGAEGNLFSATADETVAHIRELLIEKESFFRKSLPDIPCCVVCGATRVSILRVVSYGDDEEKRKGLIFCPTHGSLFAAHLISFSSGGRLIISAKLSDIEQEQFNLHKGQLIHGRFSGRRMAAHRKICHEEGRREK